MGMLQKFLNLNESLNLTNNAVKYSFEALSESNTVE